MIVGTPRGLSEITPERKLEITKLIDSIAEQYFKAEAIVLTDDMLKDFNERWGSETFSLARKCTVYYVSIKLIIDNINGAFFSSKHDKAVSELIDTFDGAFLYERLKSVISEMDTPEDFDNLASLMIAQALAEKRRQSRAQNETKKQSKSRKQSKTTAQSKEDKLEKSHSDYVNMPSTPAIKDMCNLVNYGLNLRDNDKLELLKEREYIINSNKDVQFLTSNKKPGLIRVEIKSDKSEGIYDVDMAYLKGEKSPVQQIFSFVLSEIWKIQHDGEVITHSIEFPLGKLIETGIYENEDTARRGFKEAMRALTKISVEGWIKISQRKRAIWGTGSMFSWAEVRNNTCRVLLNSEIAKGDWNFFFAFYLSLPYYAFNLNNNAFTIMLTICFTGRQQSKQIRDKGYIEIKILTFQTRLMLPDRKDTIHARRDIQEPIEKGIEDIEALDGGRDFDFLFVDTDGKPIEADATLEYFLTGKLRIYFKGELKNKYAIPAENKTRKKLVQKLASKKHKNEAEKNGDESR